MNSINAVIKVSDSANTVVSQRPSMYEETTNIPFIVRWPGECPENKSSESLISHNDLVPTVLDFARKPSYMYTSRTRQKLPEPGEKTQLDYIRKKH